MFLAVVLSVVVWVGALFENQPRAGEFGLPIPVEVLNESEDLVVAGEIPATVKVTILAPDRMWTTLTADRFHATLDMADLGPGTHEVPIVVRCDERQVRIQDYKPKTAQFSLERQGQRKMKVRARVLDEESVPLGYISKLPEVSPIEVMVSGAASLVDGVAEAVADVSLRGARATVRTSAKVILLDQDGNVINGLAVNPASVIVTVPIEEQLGYRTLTVRVVLTGTPASGYWVSSITVEPSAVTVFGNPDVIGQLPGVLDTQPIDISGADEDVVQRVPLALPEGVLVLGEGVSEGVQVRVSIQASLGGQTVRRTIVIQGLRSGYKATISPETVDIILSGPLPVLQQLKDEDVQVVVDLTRLVVGTHQVKPVVRLTEGLGLAVKSIVPESIEVQITMR